MDNKHVTEDDLFLLACGELDPARREAVEKAAANNPALAEKLEEFVQILQVVKKGDMTMASNDFNASLRAKLEWELQDVATVKHKPRRRLFPKLATAAAVLIVAGLALFGILNRPRSSIAWADVVQQFKSLPYFNATVYIREDALQEPASFEIWMGQDGKTRLHYRDQILFGENGKVLKTFDVTKRTECEPDRMAANILENLGSVKNFSLDVLFRMLSPNASMSAPIQPQDSTVATDLVIFDVTTKGSTEWVRVWALRNSGLPIRMRSYNPSGSESGEAVFSYDRPQPAKFFDPAAFEVAIKSSRLNSKELPYALMEDIGGQPLDHVQVFQGRDITPPKLLGVVTNTENHLLLVSDRPRNRSLQGGTLSDNYADELHDNWGNLYLRYYSDGFSHPDPNRYAQYYEPVPPFKQGDGKHIVTLLYTAWSFHVKEAKDAGMGYDEILYNEDIEVPEPTVEGIPQGWPGNEKLLTFMREQAFRVFYLPSIPPLEALRMTEELLKDSPESDQLLGCKMSALERLEGPEAAATFFEKTLMERGLAQAPPRGIFDSYLSQYLRYKYKAGDLDTVLAVIEKETKARQRVLKQNADDPRAMKDLKMRFENNIELTTWLKLPSALEGIATWPKPKTERVMYSSDGYLFVVVAPSENKASQNSPGLHRGFWVGPHPGNAWRGCTTYSKRNEDKRFLPPISPPKLFILPCEGDKFTLRLLTPFDLKGFSGISLPYDLQVDIPAKSEFTREELKKQFPEFIPATMTEPTPPFGQTLKQAHALRRDGDYAAALEVYRQALEMPDEEPIQSNIKDPHKAYLYRLPERLDTISSVANCLIHLEKAEEALAAFDRMAETLPLDDDETGYLPRYLIKQRIKVGAEAAAALIEKGNLNGAQEILDDLNRDRPDFRTLPNLHTTEKLPYGMGSSQVRANTAAAWLAVDRAMWQLDKARKNTGTVE